MKRMVFLLTLCANLAINAMELDRKLYVQNQFPAPIKLEYIVDYSEKDPRKLNLSPDEIKELPEWRLIKQILIKPGGVTTERLFSWLGTPIDYHVTLHQEAARLAQTNHNEHIKLLVSPKRTLLGKISGYKVDFEPTQALICIVPSERHLMDAFPRVKAAIEAKEVISPRYILGVGADAKEVDIDTAYHLLIDKWEPMAHGPNAGDASYARAVLNAADIAYASLKKEVEVPRAKEALDRQKEALERQKEALDGQLTQTKADFEKYTKNSFLTSTRFPE